MNPNDMLCFLIAKWQFYLLERGHHIRQAGKEIYVWKSRSPDNVRYRWFLLVCQETTLRLNALGRSHIRKQLEQAKAQKEMFYLVVGFLHEPPRIVVLPAAKALKSGIVRSDKGGIAW